jgi:hypothetical protein
MARHAHKPLTGIVVQAYYVRASRGAGVLSPMIGTILAHYRVVRKLSGGGMGIVCEAEDLRLGLRAAINFIRNISGASGKAGFSTPQDHQHLRMLLLRSK